MITEGKVAVMSDANKSKTFDIYHCHSSKNEFQIVSKMNMITQPMNIYC